MTGWRSLVAEVPREPFLPEVIWIDGPGRTFLPVSRTGDPERWAELTEDDQPVITQVDDGELMPGVPGVIPASSASQPSIVAGMLDALDSRPGQRVLEIGTGTGWNAALLARRVGDSGQVVSVEIDAGIARAARRPSRHRSPVPAALRGTDTACGAVGRDPVADGRHHAALASQSRGGSWAIADRPPCVLRCGGGTGRSPGASGG